MQSDSLTLPVRNTSLCHLFYMHCPDILGPTSCWKCLAHHKCIYFYSFSGSRVNFYVIPRVCETLKLMSLPKHLSSAPIRVIPAAVLVSFSCCCLSLFSYTPPVCLPPTVGEALQENETCISLARSSARYWLCVRFRKEAVQHSPLG